MGDEKSEIVMASRDRERDRELLIPVADSPDLDIASKPSSSSSASSSHHSGRELDNKYEVASAYVDAAHCYKKTSTTDQLSMNSKSLGNFACCNFRTSVR
uniref:Uncharacterized protein n=1 Tax=Salix viminalis TaxID=40686 RepID=A0A6N2M2C1_SALVM